MREITKKLIMIIFTLLIVTAVPMAASADEQKLPEQKQEQKAGEDKVTGEVNLSVLSAYILRGYEQSRNSVVVQPSVTLGYKGFALNLWGNLDTEPYAADNADHSSQYTETDYTISYSKKFGILQVTPGYVYYALGAPYSGAPAPPDSQEFFLALGLNTILSPTLTVYKEFDHYHQWYFLLGVSHTFELSKMVGLKLAASASYLKSEDETFYAKYDSNSQPTTDKYNNFHDGMVSVYLPIAVTKALTVIPTASYVFPLCNDARYEMKAFGKKGVAAGKEGDRDSTYLYGGVTLTFSF